MALMNFFIGILPDGYDDVVEMVEPDGRLGGEETCRSVHSYQFTMRASWNGQVLDSASLSLKPTRPCTDTLFQNGK